MIEDRVEYIKPLLSNIHAANDIFSWLHPEIKPPGQCPIIGFALAVDQEKLAAEPPSPLELVRYLGHVSLCPLGVISKPDIAEVEVLAHLVHAHELITGEPLEKCNLLASPTLDPQVCQTFINAGKSGLVIFGAPTFHDQGHMVGGHFDEGALCLGSIARVNDGRYAVRGRNIPIDQVDLTNIGEQFGGYNYYGVWAL